ncbi:MAG: hypothetical protein WC718_17625, partial [Phycisphaerales bacterium]
MADAETNPVPGVRDPKIVRLCVMAFAMRADADGRNVGVGCAAVGKLCGTSEDSACRVRTWLFDRGHGHIDMRAVPKKRAMWWHLVLPGMPCPTGCNTETAYPQLTQGSADETGYPQESQESGEDTETAYPQLTQGSADKTEKPAGNYKYTARETAAEPDPLAAPSSLLR